MGRESLGKVLLSYAAGLSLAALAIEEGRASPAQAPRPSGAVIARTWHGKTLRARADAYEEVLTAAIAKFPSIPGNRGYQMMRLDGGPDGEAYVEFQVISYWESLDAIRGYAGADVRRARDLPEDAEFLVDKEPHVRNYELRVHALRP